MDRILSFVPLWQQLRTYDASTFRSDLAAGLTVGVMLIPQGMAYALIAGVPPIYGLYAPLVPLVIYALFGTSRQLAVGPVAMISLLIAAGVAPLAGSDVETYVGLTLLLSLMVGVVRFGMGVLKGGFLANFLSHPVLIGFTSAAAIIIGFSQLKHLIGVDLPQSNLIVDVIAATVERFDQISGVTVALGIGSIMLVAGLRRLSPRIPGALVVVVLSTAVVSWFGLESLGVRTVGFIPGGLPGPVLPPIDAASIQALVPAALTIALVGFMESIAVGKVYARKHGYAIDPDKELIALGLGNIAGAFFQSFPTTGGFSRTAVNDQSGAKTNVAGLISAGIVGLTLLALTSLFYSLPNAALAAIVMVAVTKLIDVREALRLWKVDRRDFWLMMLTGVATLVLGIQEGILVGIVMSLVLVVQQSYRPHSAIVGRMPGTTSYRNLKRNPEAIQQPGLLIFRLDESLYFANIEHLKDNIGELVEADPSVETILLDLYPVNRIDSTAVRGLSDLRAALAESGIRLQLAGVKGPVRDKLDASGLTQDIGREHFFLEIHDAVQHGRRDQEMLRTAS